MGRIKSSILYTLLSVFLIIVAVSPGIAPVRAAAVEDIVFSSVTGTNSGGVVPIGSGAKAIPYDAYRIDMDFDSAYKPVSGTSLSGIRVVANGSTDETYKFDISYISGKLTIKLKNAGGPVTPYRMLEHALYNIHIPASTFSRTDTTFIPNTEIFNNEVNYTFVTAGGGNYGNDIFSGVIPADGQKDVDFNTNQIMFRFIDEIAMDTEVSSNISDYIDIRCTHISQELSVDYNGDTSSNSVSNYNLHIDADTLVLKPKNGKLNDLYSYTVILAEGTVYLRDSASGTKVYNNTRVINFDTDKIIVSSIPAAGQTGVELKPTVEFTFKYPIEAVSGFTPDMVSVRSNDGISIPVSVSSAGNVLKVYMQEALKKNTRYTVKVKENTVRFKEDNNVLNREITLGFVTTGNGQAPVAIRYSSNASGTDDVTSKGSTQLSGNGSIFVMFDRNIRMDKAYSNLRDAVSLYKIPCAHAQDYSPSGVIYDSTVIFHYSSSEDAYLPETVTKAVYLEEKAFLGSKIPLESVSIVNSDTLKITPLYQLDSLNKYKAVINRQYIEDQYGINMEEPVEISFWTKAESASVIPSWQGIKGISSEKVAISAGSSGTTYTVADAPQYGSSEAIVLDIGSEVIVNAVDKTVMEYLKPVSRISFDNLRNITLTEYYDANSKLGFSKYELQYYYSGNVKKTRLLLYPDSTLDNGKTYRLTIGANTFVSRSNAGLSKLEVVFTVKGSSSSDKRGIYSLQNNSIISAILKRDGEAVFTIIGYNFTDDIESITLSGPVTVTIPEDDIVFNSVSSISAIIRNACAEKLVKTASIGDYVVTVNFGDGIRCSSSPSVLTIRGSGKPQVIAAFPSDNINEEDLITKTIDGKKRYFLRLTFRDYNGTLDFNEPSALYSLKDTCTVCARGSEGNLIDSEFLTGIINLQFSDVDKYTEYIDKYIFTSGPNTDSAYLYIPVKPLRAQTTYDVTIVPGIVYFPDGEENDVYSWSFTTMSIPVIASISVGSVGEDYDEDEPIIIRGSNFSSSVKVHFNNEEAEKVKIKTDSNGETYLEVYLPYGRNRLEPGTYNITVENDSKHGRISYGSLSVIKSGDNVPNEENRVKVSSSKGDILSDLKVSEDTLELKSKYSDEKRIELDLDELMGQDVLVRNIKVESRRGDVIGMLETRSKWSDITIYKLRRDYLGDGDEILLKLGRVEAVVRQALEAKLHGKAVKSELIQVSGENFYFEKVVLDIPFVNSSGNSIEVLRYDEGTRSWQRAGFTVNLVDRRVNVESYSPGIFVVVE